MSRCYLRFAKAVSYTRTDPRTGKMEIVTANVTKKPEYYTLPAPKEVESYTIPWLAEELSIDRESAVERKQREKAKEQEAMAAALAAHESKKHAKLVRDIRRKEKKAQERISLIDTYLMQHGQSHSGLDRRSVKPKDERQGAFDWDAIMAEGQPAAKGIFKAIMSELGGIFRFFITGAEIAKAKFSHDPRQMSLFDTMGDERPEMTLEEKLAYRGAQTKEALRRAEETNRKPEPPQPHEMTKDEFWQSGAGGKAYEGKGTADFNHKIAIKQALASGKHVPAHVLADYPNLQKPSAPLHKEAVQVAATTRTDKKTGAIIPVSQFVRQQEKRAETAPIIRHIETYKPPTQEKKKEPWQMTREEFVGDKTDVDAVSIARMAHPQHVKDAIARGETIPDEVLKNYILNGLGSETERETGRGEKLSRYTTSDDRERTRSRLARSLRLLRTPKLPD